MKSTIKVNGMHCHGCVALIKDVLGDVPGVQSADATIKDAAKQEGVVVVEHDAKVTEKQLRAAIEAEGYRTA